MRIRNLLCLLLRPVSIRRQTNLQLPATVRLLPRLEFRPHSTFAQSSDSCLSLEFAATEFFIFVFSFLLSLGFVRGGTVDELNLLGNKNWGKEEILRFLAENLRNLEKFFYGFAVKLDNLKCIIQSTIDSREITLEDFQPPLASKVVEALINNGGNTKVVFLENYKPSRKIKDLGDVGFELLQSFGSLLGEKLVGSKPNKVKNNVMAGGFIHVNLIESKKHLVLLVTFDVEEFYQQCDPDGRLTFNGLSKTVKKLDGVQRKVFFSFFLFSGCKREYYWSFSVVVEGGENERANNVEHTREFFLWIQTLSTTYDEVIVYPILAALYLVQNLLQYYIFAYVDASGYQILKNFNIINTGLIMGMSIILTPTRKDPTLSALGNFAAIGRE
uniref:Uncharacterized protein n=1 Tax=Cucumis melo TaxID=3656 RepID=A0A9I9CI63_CUCME